MPTGLIAPLSIICGMMVLAISDNFIWMVADKLSVWQFHAARAAMILPVIVLSMVLLKQAGTIRPKRPGAVAFRAFCTIMALMLYFAAIPAVGVSIAAAGLFTSPIFVVLISHLAFHEHIGWPRIAAMVLGFAGVCLVLGIGTEPIRIMAVAPMIGGALYAVNVVWTRRYCRQESAGALSFWNMAMFLAVGSAGTLATPWLAAAIGHIEGAGFATMSLVRPDFETLALVFAMGVAGALGMVFLAIGYRGAPSSYAALFDYSFLFWVPLFAWVLRGEVLSSMVAIGMGLIVLAGSLAVWDAPREIAEGQS